MNQQKYNEELHKKLRSIFYILESLHKQFAEIYNEVPIDTLSFVEYDNIEYEHPFYKKLGNIYDSFDDLVMQLSIFTDCEYDKEEFNVPTLNPDYEKIQKGIL
jgi:hypothetical protein